MKKYILPILIVVAYSCSPRTESSVPLSESDKLPDTRPADFVLTSRMDGGMSNHKTDLFISKDSAYLKDDNRGVITERKFMLTAPALDTLYAILKQNKFDQIQSTLDTLTLDRGGVEVSVTWEMGQRGVTASDSGQMFVTDEWAKQWGAVLRYLDTLVPAK